MKKFILFVDDEINVLNGLRRMLFPMKKEWEMFFSISGDQALKVLSEKPIDVVVTDMRMPNMDGVQLLTEVHKRYPRVIRIILSGHSDQEMILKSVTLAHQFLTKPCPADKIKETVNSTYNLHKIIENEEAKAMVSKIESLPSLPTLYTQVIEETNKEDSSLGKVGELISMDVGMSANVLKLVNSSFFGLVNHISSPSQAVNLLGLEVVKGLILSSHLFHTFQDSESPLFSLEKMMNHCVLVARLSKHIAKELGMDKKQVDDCFIAGMLHDLGKLVLLANFKVSYDVVIQESRMNNRTIWVSEKDVLGTTHTEIGAYLLGLWGLPEDIIEAVALHHIPNFSMFDTITPLTAVHLANVFEHKIVVYNDNYDRHQLDIDYIERLGIQSKIDQIEASCIKICEEVS